MLPTRYYLAGFILLLFCDRMAYSQTAPSFETVISIIKDQEKKFKNAVGTAKWSLTGRGGKHNLSSDRFEPGTPDEVAKSASSAIFNPLEGKYRIRSTGVFKAGGEPPSYNWMDEIVAFDGKKERHWRRVAPGTERPSEPGIYSLGAIHSWDQNRFLRDHGSVSGIGYFPPYAFNVHLSEFLDAKFQAKEIHSIEMANGIAEITTSPPQDILKADSLFKIYYDTNKGLVTKGDHIGKPVLKMNANKVWQKHEISWSKIGDVYVPTKIYEYSLLDGIGVEFTFNDVKINSKQDDIVYTVDFPHETRVSEETEDPREQKGLEGAVGYWVILWSLLGVALFLTIFYFLKDRRQRKGSTGKA